MDMIQLDSNEMQILPDVLEYKSMIAQVILFKAAHKLIRPKFPAFQANVTAYLVAVLSKTLGDRLDLSMIWQNQGISTGLGTQILTWSTEVNRLLHESAGGRMISEWAKRKECWEILSAHKYSAANNEIIEIKRV